MPQSLKTILSAFVYFTLTLFLLGPKPKTRKYTKGSKNSFRLTPFQVSALFGLLLGDVHLERLTPNGDTRACFTQSKAVHGAYLLFLYSVFESLVGTPTKPTDRKPDKRTGKTDNSLVFKSLALPCLNYLYELFYVAGCKIVPALLPIMFYKISLAFWIMDDGGRTVIGELRQHTNSFTYAEVDFLCKMLTDKY